jgi:hypothetical protein
VKAEMVSSVGAGEKYAPVSPDTTCAGPLYIAVSRPVSRGCKAILSAGVVSLFACSFAADGAGVDANFSEAPDWACVTAEVRKIGSVEVLFERSDSTGRLLTWHGLTPPGNANALGYKLAGITYAVQVISEPGMPVEYRHQSFFPHGTASAEALALSLREVTKVATMLETSCHMVEIVGNARQFCRGKNCPRDLTT